MACIKKTTFLFCLLLGLATLVTAKSYKNIQRVRYDNYKLYRLVFNSADEVLKFRTFKAQTGVSTWKEQSDGRLVDVMIPPSLKDKFESLFDSTRSSLLLENVQEAIDESNNGVADPDANGVEEFGWKKYNTLDEINQWLYQLADSYPNVVKVVKGGKSYEGRDIIGVHLSYSENNKNRTAFIESNIHACEWITSAVTTYMLNQFLTSNDTQLRKIVENYDWYFFPVFNPDGFVYTHNVDRLWRKTRQPYGKCVGADPNRNWDYYWDTTGTSNNSCSETYAGPQAFSEPLTRSLSKFISSIGKSLVAYLDFHSYSQLLMFPYGYTTDHLDNYNQLESIGLKAAKKLSERYGTQYTVGDIAETIYLASGSSLDWVKGTYHTPITYAYELRDTGRYGFLLPPDQIIPCGEETLDSVIEIFTEAKKQIKNIN